MQPVVSVDRQNRIPSDFHRPNRRFFESVHRPLFPNEENSATGGGGGAVDTAHEHCRLSPFRDSRALPFKRFALIFNFSAMIFSRLLQLPSTLTLVRRLKKLETNLKERRFYCSRVSSSRNLWRNGRKNQPAKGLLTWCNVVCLNVCFI